MTECALELASPLNGLTRDKNLEIACLSGRKVSFLFLTFNLSIKYERS